MENMFDYIGFYGPYINFVILLNQKQFLFGYLVFLILNVMSNKIFKNAFKEPRPLNGKLLPNERDIYADKYGMPSGHAQTVFYPLIYLYLVKQNMYLLFIESFVAILTVYQRWNYRRHTPKQLLIGSIIGSFVGYVGFNMTNYFLKTKKNISN